MKKKDKNVGGGNDKNDFNGGGEEEEKKEKDPSKIQDKVQQKTIKQLELENTESSDSGITKNNKMVLEQYLYDFEHKNSHEETLRGLRSSLSSHLRRSVSDLSSEKEKVKKENDKNNAGGRNQNNFNDEGRDEEKPSPKWLTRWRQTAWSRTRAAVHWGSVKCRSKLKNNNGVSGGHDDNNGGGGVENDKKSNDRDGDGNGDKDDCSRNDGGEEINGKNMDFKGEAGFSDGYGYHAGNENGCPVGQLRCAQEAQSSDTTCLFYHAIMKKKDKNSGGDEDDNEGEGGENYRRRFGKDDVAAAGYPFADDALHNAPAKRKRKLGTEEEHRQFTLGLQKPGKGDWSGISRNHVQTRTPTQAGFSCSNTFFAGSIPAANAADVASSRIR